jgi:hypothetical protein
VSQLRKLKPISKGILEYAIDEGRVRFLSQETDSWRRLTIWDGKQLVAHEEYLSDDQEHYYLDWTAQGNFHDLIAFQTSWPRSQPHSFWWDRKDVDELLCYYGRPEEFAVTGQSSYHGADCYVLDLYPRDLFGIVTGQSYRCDSGVEDSQQYGHIGEARGLADQTYRWYIGTNDHRLRRLVWLVSKKPHVEHSMLDYRQVGPGYWFPMTQSYVLYGRDGDGESYVEARRDLKVLDVRINEQLPDEWFQIKLSKGVTVIDNRSGRSVTYRHEPDPPDLLGKTLPDFRDINVEFAQDRTQDGMSLVCFWDMEQRPSRYCLRQLSRRARELKAQDMIVVAVQASRVDPKDLNEWTEENDVPFPVGIVQGDERKTRFSWGVRSLPWLILADRRHIVRAEGFALSELDERIGHISRE